MNAAFGLVSPDSSDPKDYQYTLLASLPVGPGETWHKVSLDLSAYAHEANTLNLFSFLHVENGDVPPDEVVVSATADVGMTVWFDRARLMNHHSRQLAIPSFHRAEGGAAFLHPLKRGDRKLVHIKLYSCLPPLTCTLMFGDLHNDPLDGFNLSI